MHTHLVRPKAVHLPQSQENPKANLLWKEHVHSLFFQRSSLADVTNFQRAIKYTDKFNDLETRLVHLNPQFNTVKTTLINKMQMNLDNFLAGHSLGCVDNMINVDLQLADQAYSTLRIAYAQLHEEIIAFEKDVTDNLLSGHFPKATRQKSINILKDHLNNIKTIRNGCEKMQRNLFQYFVEGSIYRDILKEGFQSTYVKPDSHWMADHILRR